MARSNDISVRKAFEGVAIIDLAGELISSGEDALLNAYQQASDDGARVLILNFSRLEYKNSSGMKLLVILITRANAARQHLFAAEMNQDYQNIFQVAQLNEGITIYASEADAVQAAHDLLDKPGTPHAVHPRGAPARSTVTKRPTDAWAKPVDRLNMAEIPAGARALNVQGRALFGPLQGFGQMWQKTYRTCLSNSKLTPQEIITIWKQNVPSFKPSKKRFFPSSTGITPNALVLIDAQTPGGPISTGVMVLYASAESFALMTPAGHPEAGWVTFSSYIEDGSTFAQVQVLARASDPLYELAFRLAGDKLQDRVWTHVLTALAAMTGTSGEVQMHKTLLDSKLQWKRAGNTWYNAQLRTLLYTPIAWLHRIGTRLAPNRSRRRA